MSICGIVAFWKLPAATGMDYSYQTAQNSDTTWTNGSAETDMHTTSIEGTGHVDGQIASTEPTRAKQTFLKDAEAALTSESISTAPTNTEQTFLQNTEDAEAGVNAGSTEQTPLQNSQVAEHAENASTCPYLEWAGWHSPLTLSQPEFLAPAVVPALQRETPLPHRGCPLVYVYRDLPEDWTFEDVHNLTARDIFLRPRSHVTSELYIMPSEMCSNMTEFGCCI
eukprot:1908258-Amphidinium_carterae.1